MDDTQQFVDLGRVALLNEKLNSVATEAQQVLAELSSQLENLQKENQRLIQDLEHERTVKQEFTVRLESVEGEKQRLEDENQQLNQDLDSERKRCAKLRRELENSRSTNQVLQCEKHEIKEAARKEKEQFGWKSAKELSPLLADLSALAGLEPESVKGLTPRAALEKLREWIERATGEKPVPFPSKREVSADHTLLLDPDEADLEFLMEKYDWQPDHPFERLPAGERARHFRVLRHGWCIGESILVRARVVPEKANE